jgi:hypothetical protein
VRVSTTTVFRPSRFPLPAPAVHYISESWWTCPSGSTGQHHYRERLDSLLAIGQLLSVIPPNATERFDLEIMPERGWKGQVPTWFGVPCRIGRVTVWLPTLEGPAPLRSFPLLALFPREDIEDAPPFVHLGTQFLLEHRAELHLDCSSPTGEGRLVFP